MDITYWEFVYIAIDNKYVKFLYPIELDSSTLTAIGGNSWMDWRVNITMVDWHSASSMDLTLMGVFASSVTNIWIREIRADFFGCFYTCLDCFVDNSANHCTACIDGYYLNNFQCKPCDASCAKCQTSSSFCIACSGGKHLYQNQCVDTCPTGFYVDSLNVCTACGAFCQSCISNTNCIVCNNGYYSSGGSCLACNPSCSKCATVSTNCLECSNSALLAQAGSCVVACGPLFYQSGKSCFSCPVGCATCSSSTVCTSCSPGFLFQEISCKTVCDLGYYQSSPTACSPCDSTCKACSGTATSCISCPDKFYLNGQSCAPCKSPCVTCLGESDCLSCIDPLVELAKKCVPTCPNGKYALGGRCQNCETPCATCKDSSRNCSSCKPGYAFLMSSCLKNCPVGYHIYNQKVCCPDECIACDEISGACIECTSSHFLNLTSHECLPCNSLCTECRNSPEKCTKCGNAFFLFNNTCVISCPEDGFYVDNLNSECKTCYPQCKTCVGASQADCVRCNDGFALYKGKCIACGALDSPFDLVDGNCVDRCGDGKRFSPEDVPFLATYNICDDGNIIDGDGCSSHCEVEQGFSCFFGNETSPDICRENISPVAKISKISDNKLLITFSESIKNWTELEISNYVRLKSSKLIQDTNYTYSVSKTSNDSEFTVDINFLNSVQSEKIRILLDRNNITDLFGNRLRTSQLTVTLTYKIYPRLGSEGFLNATSIAFGIFSMLSATISPISGTYLCQSSFLALLNAQRVGYHYLLNSVYQDDINFAMFSLFRIFNVGLSRSWERNDASLNSSTPGLATQGRLLEEFSGGIAQGGLYFANDFINNWITRADAFYISEFAIVFLIIVVVSIACSLFLQSKESKKTKSGIKWCLHVSSTLMIAFACFLHFPVTVKSLHNLMLINVSSLTEILIGLLSLLMFLFCLALPAIVFLGTNRDTMILWHPHYYLRFGSLYALMKIDRPITRNFFAVVLAKNALLGIFLVSCINSPLAQNLMMCFVTAGYCGLVIKYRPFVNVYLTAFLLTSEANELGLHVVTIINSFLIKRHHSVMLSITSQILHAFYIIFILCNLSMFFYLLVFKVITREDLRKKFREWCIRFKQRISGAKVAPAKDDSLKSSSIKNLKKSQTIQDSPGSKSEIALNKFKSQSMDNIASVKELVPLESEKVFLHMVTLEEESEAPILRPQTSDQQPAIFNQATGESNENNVMVHEEPIVLNSEEEFLKAQHALLNIPTDKVNANNFVDVDREDEEYFAGYRD